MNQLWFEDIMSQKFHEDICFNPSKIVLMKFLYKDGIRNIYRIADFQEYLYRVYMDNPEVAQKHPSYIIRNIRSYGVSDLQDLASDTIESWNRDSKNHLLEYNDKYIRICISEEDYSDTEKNMKRLALMLYKKYFGGSYPEVSDIGEIADQDDHDIEVFGKGKYRDRVLEDMQYCPLCEEIRTNNLVAVHILEKRMGASVAELLDKKNGILMCTDHAIQFLNGDFYFDELGFARNIRSKDVEDGMHLSFSIRNSMRKQYIKRRNEFLDSQ